MKKLHSTSIALIIIVAITSLLAILWPHTSNTPVIYNNTDGTLITNPNNNQTPTETPNVGSGNTPPPEGRLNPDILRDGTVPIDSMLPPNPNGSLPRNPNLPTIQLPRDTNIQNSQSGLPNQPGTTSSNEPKITFEGSTNEDFELIPANQGQTLNTGEGSGVTIGSGGGGTLSQIIIVNMNASEWQYNPQTITARQGDTLHMNITSQDSNHCISIPGFNIFAEIPAGETIAIEFSLDRAGNFAFFCPLNYSSGRSDMNGTIIVTAS